MAFQAGKNTNYGGAVVTQKYSPLLGINYNPALPELLPPLIAECGALLTNRLNQLIRANMLPQPLRLVTDWDSAIAAVSAHEPPLVVISSNRSNWIGEGVRMAGEQWRITGYEGSNDLRALTGSVARQTQSPPLYVPKRTEGERKVFIVVHVLEYNQYREALKDSGMTVVGWSLNAPAAAADRGQLTGFGASRYAAIEFCKHLRANMVGKKWDYAWLLDDNVVGITGFPGYAVVEGAMRAASPEQVCLAFKGGAGVESFATIKKWANDEKDATPTRMRPTVLPPPETTRGIIQQAALWNIKYLTEKKLNFAPLFVASGEDVSLTNYFNVDIAAQKELPAKPAIPFLFYNMKVRKEVVGYKDESKGAKAVEKAKAAYEKWFADEEAKATPTGSDPPPPVEVESPAKEKLSEFITKWFTGSDKPIAVAAGDPKVQNTAKCQAVEQIACGAILNKCVSTDVLNSTFVIPGVAGQAILRFPPPPLSRT